MPDQYHHKTARADFEFIDCKHEDQPFRAAFLEGMTADEKAIPCRYLYDERGSQLFRSDLRTPRVLSDREPKPASCATRHARSLTSSATTPS